jgi:release factor glutamine methyltransferase
MTTQPAYKHLLEILSRELVVLADKPEETPQSTLHSLWHAATGKYFSIEASLDKPLEDLSHEQEESLQLLVKQRLSGTPLAHLVGRQRFMGIDFMVGPNALAPRKETELLAGTALELVRTCIHAQGAAVALDVCTGIGNIAITIAYNEAKVKVYAGDISPDAIKLARQNASMLNLDDRIVFRVGDLFEPFRDVSLENKIDVLSCNPPYISTGKLKTLSPEIINHEPLLAFDGGPFGLKILSRIFKEGLLFLKPGGFLCFEVGLGQGPGMIQLLQKSLQFSSVSGATNSKGEIRVVIAQR